MLRRPESLDFPFFPLLGGILGGREDTVADLVADYRFGLYVGSDMERRGKQTCGKRHSLNVRAEKGDKGAGDSDPRGNPCVPMFKETIQRDEVTHKHTSQMCGQRTEAMNRPGSGSESKTNLSSVRRQFT
jgi:hypothetical protein